MSSPHTGGHESEELGRQAARGVGLVGVATVGIRLLSFLQTIVLARLLEPSDFGLFTLSIVVCGLAGVLGDAGVGAIVVRRTGVTREEFSSLFWTGIALGTLAAFVVIAIAPSVATLFGDRRLTLILALNAISLATVAVGAPFQSLLERSLEFRKITILELACQLAGSISAIALAISGVGVFALVGGALVTSFSRTVAFFLGGLRLVRPLFRIRLDDLRPHVPFTVNYLGHRLANVAASNVDFIWIGMFVDVRSLGFYVLAYNLINVPATLVNPPLSRVFFPVLSRLRRSPEKMKSAYFGMQEAAGTVNFPLLLGMAATAQVFVPVLYGPNWTESARLLEILVVVGLVRSIHGNFTPFVLAKGRTDLAFRMSAATLAIQAPALLIAAITYGELGVAVTYSGLSCIFLVLSHFVITRRVFGPCGGEFSWLLAPIFGKAVLMAAIVFAVNGFVAAPPSAGLLAGLVTIGMISYALFLWPERDRVRAVVTDLLRRGPGISEPGSTP